VTSLLAGCSGAGALAAPLVATQFAQRSRWSFHYLTSVAVATLNTALLICVFKFKTQDGELSIPSPFNTSDFVYCRDSECLAQIGQVAEEKEGNNDSKYKEMFRLKALHLLSFFILVYVGVEVTIGGTSLAPPGPP
jgi:fucose permease